MSEENVGLVRQAYEAWNRGDLEWLLNHITPASEFRTARVFPDVEAAYRGQEGFTQFWNAIREPCETFHIEVERLEPVSDDRVLALFWFHGLGRQGVEVTSKFAQLFTLAEGMLKQQVGLVTATRLSKPSGCRSRQGDCRFAREARARSRRGVTPANRPLR